MIKMNALFRLGSFLVLMLLTLPLVGQSESNQPLSPVIKSPDPNLVFAQFKGGKKGLDEYLKKSVRLPDSLSTVNKEGVIVLHYTVGTNNKVVLVNVVTQHTTLPEVFHPYITKVLLASGPWKCATRKGKPIKSLHEVSFSF
tara:strand:- start:645 stop:1070 length:426 start_codon:yes stop_codon:yes gene_type:complete